MGQFVALLRGVNVGKAKRVPMAEWRGWLEELGCESPRTLLNSGNVVFGSKRRQADALAADIAALMQERLGFEVPVLVKSAAELDVAVAEQPWTDAAEGLLDASRLLVIFSQQSEALAALHAPVRALVQGPERWHVGRQAAYLYCAAGILESAAGNALLGKRGPVVTSRNWATVQKLKAMIES